MIKVLLVALGGALGSICRYWIGKYGMLVWGAAFPFGILCVNVLGSLLIGIFGALLYHHFKTLHQYWMLFVMTGFMGGLTTFSSFSFDTFSLFYDGKLWLGFANILLNVVLCLLATALGFLIINKGLTVV